jgi:hypothetical protein
MHGASSREDVLLGWNLHKSKERNKVKFLIAYHFERVNGRGRNRSLPLLRGINSQFLCVFGIMESSEWKSN